MKGRYTNNTKTMTEASLTKTPPRRSHSSRVPSTPFSSCQTPTRKSEWQERTPGSQRLTTVVPRISPSPGAAHRRLHTPGRAYGSNSSPYQETGDRFIPSRRDINMDLCRHFIQSGEKRRREDEARGRNVNSSPPVPTPHSSQETSIQKEFKRRMLSSLCNIPLEMLNEDCEPNSILSFGSSSNNNLRRRDEGAPPQGSFGVRLEDPYAHGMQVLRSEPHTVDPIGLRSVATKVQRKIPTAPTRILDAPDLVDDYYLNLISWSQDNILAVALGQCIYLWNAGTGDIQHLCTIRGADDYATSVSWCTVPGQTKYLAIGTNSNTVQLWDAQSLRKVRTLTGHTGRVGSLAWSRQWLSSGSRDSTILQHDVRSANHVVAQYKGHAQEVCGLRWTEDSTTLASGGNENYVCLWDAAMSASSFMSQRRQREGNNGNDVAPRLVLTEHNAAVKALAWCPFHRGLLASGGGTADRTIKFWNANSGSMLNSIDTGSQVCALLWSRHQRELCSSHGFSENQLILWKYPTMTKIQEFKGHTSRVLNMELSPDGGCVVSAAADETLRFWDIFGPPPRKQGCGMLSMGELSLPGMPTVR